MQMTVITFSEWLTEMAPGIAEGKIVIGFDQLAGNAVDGVAYDISELSEVNNLEELHQLCNEGTDEECYEVDRCCLVEFEEDK